MIKRETKENTPAVPYLQLLRRLLAARHWPMMNPNLAHTSTNHKVRSGARCFCPILCPKTWTVPLVQRKLAGMLTQPVVASTSRFSNMLFRFMRRNLSYSTHTTHQNRTAQMTKSRAWKRKNSLSRRGYSALISILQVFRSRRNKSQSRNITTLRFALSLKDHTNILSCEAYAREFSFTADLLD